MLGLNRIAYTSTSRIVWLALIFAVHHVVCQAQNDFHEVCQWETFKAHCPQHKVIMVEQARYGRLQLGRCIKKDFGWLGCSADVIAMADRKCSGRRQCEINVYDTFGELRPCTELESSFSAIYSCIKVSHVPNSCQDREERDLTLTSGILSSTDTNRHVTSPHCPLLLRAKPGQKWNITLIDFASADSQNTQTKPAASSDNLPPRCQRYAIIKEEGDSRGAVICGGERRERTVFLSQGNLITIQMFSPGGGRGGTDGGDGEGAPQFLLKYDAIGCPNPLLEHGVQMKRVGEEATFTCNNTSNTWSLTCESGRWIGRQGSCAEEPVWTVWSVLTKEDWATPYGILIVTGLGIALGVIIGFSLLVAALFCIRRRQRARHPHKAGEGYDDITAYRNQSVSSKDALDLQVNYQSATMVRHKLASTLPPLPSTQQSPTPHHHNYYRTREPLPAIPIDADGYDISSHSQQDIPPPPYPCADVLASGYSVSSSGYGGGGGEGSATGCTVRYATHYTPGSNTSASSMTEHVYEVPH